MVVVGLTGAIGSGKSSVAALLAERGAVVVDSDDLAREVVEPGQAAHAAVIERFGPGVVVGDGQIDRQTLADMAFADPAARSDLEAIVHPAVAAAWARRLAALVGSAEVVIAVVPLLVEVGWEGADVVVAVDCPEDMALRRLVKGRGMSEADARRRMAAQATRAERLAAADRVIVNDGTWEDLRAQVELAWEWIQTLPPRSGWGLGRRGEGRPEPNSGGVLLGGLGRP
ncbi:MAG: dephospho-CoA kinase, partial [Acidimicrobiales bacterium]